MKVHSEISISRLVLYISVLVSLSGKNLSDNNSANLVTPDSSRKDSIANDCSMMRNLHDTGFDKNPIYWYKYGLDK